MAGTFKSAQFEISVKLFSTLYSLGKIQNARHIYV